MPTAKVPDVLIKVAGIDVRQYESVSTTWTAYHEPSTFEASFPLTDAIQKAIIAAKAPTCDIYVDGKPWFNGLINSGDGDRDELEPSRILKIHGQDLMKHFFRTPILETIKSRTAEEWVGERARAHGLKAKISPSNQPIGALVESNHSTLSNHQKESDLLQELGAWNGYVARVDLDTFIWGPPPVPSIHKEWQLGRDFNIHSWSKSFEAELIRVEVIGWSPRKKKGLKQSKATVGSGKYLIRRVVPGITVKAAEKLAQAILEQAERSALYVDVPGLPGDVRLRGLGWDFTLLGVGPGLSQKYFPTSVKHTFTPDSHTLDVGAFNKVEAQA